MDVESNKHNYLQTKKKEYNIIERVERIVNKM